jgi:dCMP deaminase
MNKSDIDARMLGPRVGIVGTSCSGKGTVAKFLQEYGYHYVSLSDMLREDAEEKGLDSRERQVLIDLGNKYREAYGAGGLMVRAIQRIKQPAAAYVFDSIRNPIEVEALRTAFPQTLIFSVDADPQVRYGKEQERERKTGRKAAPSYERFLEIESSENSDNPLAQQLRATMQSADLHLWNDFTPAFFDKLERIVHHIPNLDARKKPFPQYFMGMAHQASTRSTCSKRKVGAVLVKDRYILTTGYNGTASGAIDCNAGGCNRCNDPTIKSGTRLDECVCLHAERNAIDQAAMRSMPTEGTTIYTTNFPCNDCAERIVDAGVANVYYNTMYAGSDEAVLRFLTYKQVQVQQVK